MAEQHDHTVNHFDRQLGQLDSLPGGVQTKPSTIQIVTPLIGAAETWIIQTIRVPEHGDTVFLQMIRGDNSSLRLVVPPKVAEAISRQRDALTARARSKVAKAVAADRKARGLKPGFWRDPSPELREALEDVEQAPKAETRPTYQPDWAAMGKAEAKAKAKRAK